MKPLVFLIYFICIQTLAFGQTTNTNTSALLTDDETQLAQSNGVQPYSLSKPLPKRDKPTKQPTEQPLAPNAQASKLAPTTRTKDKKDALPLFLENGRYIRLTPFASSNKLASNQERYGGVGFQVEYGRNYLLSESKRHKPGIQAVWLRLLGVKEYNQGFILFSALNAAWINHIALHSKYGLQTAIGGGYTLGINAIDAKFGYNAYGKLNLLYKRMCFGFDLSYYNIRMAVDVEPTENAIKTTNHLINLGVGIGFRF